MSKYTTVTVDGEVKDWVPNVRHNETSIDCYNAKVVFTVPNGIRITGPSDTASTVINVPVGVFNVTSKTWYIGKLSANDIITAPFEFTVDDISLAVDSRFTILATLTSSCVESNTSNNVDSFVIEVVDPCTQISLSIGVDNTASNSDLSIG